MIVRPTRDELAQMGLIQLKDRELRALVAHRRSEERRREVEIEIEERKLIAAAAARQGLGSEIAGRVASDKDGPFFLFEDDKKPGERPPEPSQEGGEG